MFADGKVALQAAYGTHVQRWLFDQHLEPDAKSALGLYVPVDELLSMRAALDLMRQGKGRLGQRMLQ